MDCDNASYHLSCRSFRRPHQSSGSACLLPRVPSPRPPPPPGGGGRLVKNGVHPIGGGRGLDNDLPATVTPCAAAADVAVVVVVVIVIVVAVVAVGAVAVVAVLVEPHSLLQSRSRYKISHRAVETMP